jgi:HK97 family phage major capsid protein
VQPLEAAGVVLSSGPRIFDTSGVLRIPKLTGSSTVGFIGENELIPSDHDTTFDEVVLMTTDRKSIKVIERYSRELARQAVIGIDATLKNRLVKVVSDKMDTALLVGKGQATNEVQVVTVNGTPTGGPSPSHSRAPPHRAWLTTPPHRLCRPHCKVCRPSAPATPPSAGAPGAPTP